MAKKQELFDSATLGKDIDDILLADDLDSLYVKADITYTVEELIDILKVDEFWVYKAIAYGLGTQGFIRHEVVKGEAFINFIDKYQLSDKTFNKRIDILRECDPCGMGMIVGKTIFKKIFPKHDYPASKVDKDCQRVAELKRKGISLNIIKERLSLTNKQVRHYSSRLNFIVVRRRKFLHLDTKKEEIIATYKRYHNYICVKDFLEKYGLTPGGLNKMVRYYEYRSLKVCRYYRSWVLLSSELLSINCLSKEIEVLKIFPVRSYE